MPEIEETKFACNKCGYYIWESYDEDSTILPDSECPECNVGQLIETDEKRIVNRNSENLGEEPKKGDE